MNDQQYSFNRFSMLPPVVKNLLIINGLFFVATLAFGNFFHIDLVKLLGLHYYKSNQFHFYQIFTYMFMHGGVGHILFNMLALWMFGSTLENYWGGKKFLFYYLFCGLGAGLIQNFVIAYEVWNYTQQGYNPMEVLHYMNNAVTVGASGSIFGLLLAFGMMFPNVRIYLYFLFPIKAKWFVIAYGVLELLNGITRTNSGIAHFAHLGGMLFGIILILLWRKKKKNPYEINW